MTTKLITGKPGQGKTHFAMKLIRDAVQSGRTVYTNIDGIKLDVYPIPINDKGEMDWTLIPAADSENDVSGALIVYDEAQRLIDNRDFRYFAYKAKEKLSDRKVISELEYHRHWGHDIVFITQSPNLLHLHLLELMNEHYHCVRPMNKAGSQVALWRSWQRSPDSVAALERAEDVTFEPFDKKIFDLYKSTEEVTDAKIRIPKYIKKLGFIAAFCFLAIVALFIFVDNPMFNFRQNAKALKGDKEALEGMNKYLPPSVVEAKQTIKDTQSKLSTGVNDNPSFNADFECRKAENVDLPACKTWFNNLSRSSGSISGGQSATIDYNPHKPFSTHEVTYQYHVKQVPYFSGCVEFDGKYYGYTQQATRLEISQADCKKVLSGERPFNPFLERAPVQNLANSQNQLNSVQQYSNDDFAKFQEAKRLGLI